MALAYDRKIMYCGNVMEVYSYKEPILKEYKNKIDKQRREQTDEVIKENRDRSLRRTKDRIRNLTNTNYVAGRSSFLTLTFKENMVDYDVAFDCWKRFKQMLEYKIGKKLQYMGVVEFQTKHYEKTGRCAIHFHIALFNIDYLDQKMLYELWNKVTTGGVNIKSLNEVDNVGAYLTFYLGKDFDGYLRFERYKNKKRYFYSRNLKEPEILLMNTREFAEDKKHFENLIRALDPNVVYEYVSNPIEIVRTYGVEYQEEVTLEQSRLDGFSPPRQLYKDLQNKKELSEVVAYTQQVHYKQIILNQNSDYRKKILSEQIC